MKKPWNDPSPKGWADFSKQLHDTSRLLSLCLGQRWESYCRVSYQLPFGKGKPSCSLSNEQRRKRNSYWCLKKVMLLYLPWLQSTFISTAVRVLGMAGMDQGVPLAANVTAGAKTTNWWWHLAQSSSLARTRSMPLQSGHMLHFRPEYLFLSTFFFLMHLQAARRMGAGAAGHPGLPASQAQRGAAGSATTQPHRVAGSPAWGGTCRAKPAENPRDSIAPHRYAVKSGLESVLGYKYFGHNPRMELHWGEIVKYCISVCMETC